MTEKDDIDRRFLELMTAEFGDPSTKRRSPSQSQPEQRRHPSAPKAPNPAEPTTRNRPRSFLDDPNAGYDQGGERRRRRRTHEEYGGRGSLAADFEALGLDDESIQNADAELREGSFDDLRFDAFPSQPSTSQDYWFSMSDALDEVELDPLDPSERWRPPTPDYRPSKRGWLALGSMALAILFAILTMSGVLNSDFGVLAGLFFGASIAIALSLIPWRRDDDSDGAIL